MPRDRAVHNRVEGKPLPSGRIARQEFDPGLGAGRVEIDNGGGGAAGIYGGGAIIDGGTAALLDPA